MRQLSRFQVTWIDIATLMAIAFIAGYLCHVAVVHLIKK